MLNFSWSEDSTSLEGVETWVDKTRSSVVWIHCWSWFELEVWPDDFAKSLPAWINLWLIHQKEKYFCLHCNLFKDISCQFFSILLPPDLKQTKKIGESTEFFISLCVTTVKVIIFMWCHDMWCLLKVHRYLNEYTKGLKHVLTQWPNSIWEQTAYFNNWQVAYFSLLCKTFSS